MTSIFLSHNHRDKEFARRLANWLRNYGARIWIDEAEMKVGDSLIQKIQAGIAGAKFLGVVLSPSAVKSEWVTRELEIALNEEIDGKRVKVLPLLYRDCEISGFLRGKVYADFRKKNEFEASVKKVAAALGFEEADRSRVPGRRAIHRENFEAVLQRHFAPRNVDVEFFEDGSGLNYVKLWNDDRTFEIYSYGTRPTHMDLINTVFKSSGDQQIKGLEILDEVLIPVLRRNYFALF
jgi:TIR domain-containing protein